MRALLVLLVGCIIPSMASTAAGGLTIAREGTSDYVVVVSENPSTTDENAAKTLVDYLHQATGVQLPIVRESELTGEGASFISVGRTKVAMETLADVRWDELGHDGVVLRTSGGNLFLAGGVPRGANYAVLTFLEDVVGIRWWTSEELTVPRRPTLEIAEQNLVYTPKIIYRESFNGDAVGDGKRAIFASRLKLNGHHHLVPEEYGGHYRIIGFCHTSFGLVPPDEHFAKHPEWFAMLNGERQGATQLCLSNAEMRKTLIANALDRVRQQPESGMISISQMDGYGACQCPECQAIVAEEGSEAGLWIRLCNEAAEAINREYPDFLVETLAYVYSRQPPKSVKPSNNVLVRLCSIEADFCHPLAQDNFGSDLSGWAMIAPNLFVWNYVTNFKDYLVPHPNLRSIGEDLRFFADHRVVGVFEQGDYFNRYGGDMLPLRLWLQAHLLWDPSRDQPALVREFLNGYYGPAGPFLEEYVTLVNSISDEPNARLSCWHYDINHVRPDILAKSNALFDQAEHAVAGNADLERRVKQARLVLEHVNLLRYDFAAETTKRNGDATAAVAEYRQRVRAWAAAAHAAGVRNQGELQSLESYVPSLEMRADEFSPPVLPPAGAALAEGEFDIQQDQFRLHQRPAKSDIVDDLSASDGKAAKMPGNQTDWAIQFHIPNDAPFLGEGPWSCYIVARCENISGQTGEAFAYGMFAARGPIATSRASMPFAADGKYHTYAIRVERLEPGAHFYIAPLGTPDTVPSVSVDRIFIRREQPGR
jgi:hypothetical protein